MPKFYVESGKVRLVLDAQTAEQAAVKALHWSCDRQAEVFAEVPTDVIREAEALEFRLGDEIRVNETGFGRSDALVFDALDIAAVWQGAAFAWY